MQLQIDNRFNSLDNYFQRISNAHADPETQSYLCRFGAVLVCGNIERCVEIIILGRLTALAQPRVLEFVKSHFKRGRNLDCPAIEQLLIRFDADWYRQFHDFIEANPAIKEGISSCYTVRNSVAHGGSTGIGLARLRVFKEASKSMIDQLLICTA